MVNPGYLHFTPPVATLLTQIDATFRNQVPIGVVDKACVGRNGETAMKVGSKAL